MVYIPEQPYNQYKSAQVSEPPLWFIAWGDGMITALENIITTVSFLWAFLLAISLTEIYSRYEKASVFADFFRYTDRFG
jgi:hypothetical protein